MDSMKWNENEGRLNYFYPTFCTKFIELQHNGKDLYSKSIKCKESLEKVTAFLRGFLSFGVVISIFFLQEVNHYSKPFNLKKKPEFLNELSITEQNGLVLNISETG